MDTSSSLTLLMKVFEQEKELFWVNNTGLPEEELQKRWAAQTGEFRSILGASTSDRTTPGHPPSSSTAPKMKREQSENVEPALDPPQLTLPMSRKRTNDSHKGPSPFSSTGSSVPPLTLNHFRADEGDPFNNYTIKARRTSTGRMPIHFPVTEYDDPRDYYASLEPSQSPSVPRPSQYSSLGTSPAFSHPSTTPTTTDCTNPTTLTSTGMSRPGSQLGNAVCDGFNMLRLKSHTSNASSSFGSVAHDRQASTTSDPHASRSLSVLDNAHLFDFTTGGAVPDLPQQPLLAPSMSSSRSSSSPLNDGFPIQRTVSSISHPSPQPRVAPYGQQSVHALQPLAPKVEPIAPAMSRSISSGHRMIRVKSADGSVKDKVSITKAPYVRPQQPKIQCPHCDAKPDGYRGEHELGRHINKAHSLTRTVWVCVDISPDQKYLSKCKQCVRGKRYNAYYNAAAHLRRAHFNPRPKGRKGKSAEEETVKRAGSSGGEYPAMDFCKMWMRELREDVLPNAPPYNDADDEDDETPTDAASAVVGNQHFSNSLNPLSLRGNTGAQSISIPHPHSMYRAQLSLSAPATQFADDHSLYLSQPAAASATNDKADVLDLSFDTSMNAELPFQMSPFAENSKFSDDFSNVKF
ncbi:MAG: hypothetical protein Q9219_004692 [cf. Caloplaca sp. 3 TL-2023]